MTAAGARRSSPDGAKAPLPGVKNIIAVGAGKGGVGKTTVAVNLAIALASAAAASAMIDGDIYGPNVPIMLGPADAARRPTARRSFRPSSTASRSSRWGS